MDKRTVLAISLSIAVFLLWFYVLAPALGLMPKAPPRKAPAPPPAAAKSPAPPPKEAQPVPELPAEAKPRDYPDRPPIPFETGAFKGAFSVRGGGIERLILRFPDENGEVPVLEPLEEGRPHLALRHAGGSVALERVPWEVVEERTNEAVEFRYLLHNGVEILKTFTLDPAKRTMKVGVRLKNTNPPPEGQSEPSEQEVQLDLLAFNGLVPDEPYRHDQYMTGVAFAGKRLKYVPLGDVEKGEGKLAEAERTLEGAERDVAVQKAESYFKVAGPDVEWVGLKNRFFTVLLAPASDLTRDFVEGYRYHSASKEARKKGEGLKNLNASARTKTLRVGGAPVEMEFTAYLGPIQAEALREAPPGAGEILNYASGCGMGCGPFGLLFAPLAAIVQLVAPLILAILKFFGRDVFGNYGVGIIVTTILIRLCLFPLSKKSQATAFKMQKLQPQIEVLRKRYGDDRQKFGMEQWKLFREHKVSPASGCLPMLLQLPIFIGMYSVFELSVELRQAPFMLWITDLSQPDALVEFSGPINVFIVTFNSLNVLPIVMVVTWFLQSYFAPRSPDPQMQTQQKMMLAMPVVFGIMCYSLASGLSLYFVVNSLLGLAEQKLIKKFILKVPGDSSRP